MKTTASHFAVGQSVRVVPFGIKGTIVKRHGPTQFIVETEQGMFMTVEAARISVSK